MIEPINYVDERDSKLVRQIRSWAKADHVMEGMEEE